jgi:two-component system NtrC family sensor kinase
LLWALRERVKELTCLYGITQITAHAELDAGDAMQRIVELLPPAWQYPDVTTARIVLDDRPYVSPGFAAGPAWQTAPITAGGVRRGSVEVFYREPRPVLDEGPFLAEERSLINAVARQVAQFVERRDAARERSRLEIQLRHADRLATIGQLAAGVAHELNEPLANVLGFAQLAARSKGLSEQTRTDLDKIVAATLHAREIVKKLMLFSRQTPPAKTEVNLNMVVDVGLDFLAAQCAKQGIELVRRLNPALPEITADPGQMHQVLVNLVVNAIQAMPGGGRLTIRTGVSEGVVRLVVEDTGVGMSEEVLSKIFLPFFTTKDVDQGTGLGLSVTHGIVSAHGGSIRVQSEPGTGSRFEVVLPRPSASER